MSGPLLLRGGSVFDPATGSVTRADLRLDGPVLGADFLDTAGAGAGAGSAGADTAGAGADAGGAGADAGGGGASGGGATVIDVTGLLLTPGWVDLHTHVFVGQDLGVDPAVHGPPGGVTTMIDAGSAGAHLFGAFAAGTLTRPGPRILNFLNVSSIGTTSILLAGELATIGYVSEDAAVACAREHPGQIIGIKARASGNVCGDNGPEVLRRARAIADETGLPLMVHIGPPSPTLPEVLAVLRAGDIVTHAFTALADPRLNAILPEVTAARERGVLFDVGHGMSGFDATVARDAIAAGFAPDTISTDLHAYSASRVISLPAVVSKFLALGLTLPEALARVTLAPARAAGLDASGTGRLVPGGPADVTAIRVRDDATTYTDPQGNRFGGRSSVGVELTVQAGSIVFGERR